MNKSENHNSLGCERPLGLDVKQSPTTCTHLINSPMIRVLLGISWPLGGVSLGEATGVEVSEGVGYAA